jgi:23S rRNA pseudouridine1911/1915/1917 synthase
MALRLDLALIRRHPGLSRRKAREVIEKGQVDVDGHTIREPGRTVEATTDIRWDPNRKATPRARLSLPLLHGDEHLLVVDKPAGLLAVPTAPGAVEDTALARVQDYARHLDPRRPYVGVVHRLDRDTSGALAFALKPPVRGALRDLFREHHIERRYAALVHGRPAADEGVVDLPIHDEYAAGRRRVARAGEASRPALTRWRVLERLPGATLLEVELETGRQHQIRVHLRHVGHPVVGDAVYAAAPEGAQARRRPAAMAPRQMLHARVLGFRHPVSGSAVRVESPLPEDFLRVLRRLRTGMGGPAQAPRRNG